jgi:hypothetical protein
LTNNQFDIGDSVYEWKGKQKHAYVRKTDGGLMVGKWLHGIRHALNPADRSCKARHCMPGFAVLWHPLKLDSLRANYGADTLAFTHGTKRTYHLDERRFFNLFGSPNVCGANNICMCPSNAVEYATLKVLICHLKCDLGLQSKIMRGS